MSQPCTFSDIVLCVSWLSPGLVSTWSCPVSSCNINSVSQGMVKGWPMQVPVTEVWCQVGLLPTATVIVAALDQCCQHVVEQCSNHVEGGKRGVQRWLLPLA